MLHPRKRAGQLYNICFESFLWNHKKMRFLSLCPILRLKYCAAESPDWFLPCSELRPDFAREDKCAVGILFPV